MDKTEWLSLAEEEALDPELAICDPHHHLWDHPNSRYLIEDVVADTGAGHNVKSTVFVECASMYRKDGPEEMKPVGETEFVQGVATGRPLSPPGS
jgi:predicted TIM-barrel fold metal-dependent hydrolase